METVSPYFPLCLWVIYLVNNIAVTDLVDLTVTIYDDNENLILNHQGLTESDIIPGYYFYNLDLSCVDQLTVLNAFFKKGRGLIKVEKFYVNCPNDDLGCAF